MSMPFPEPDDKTMDDLIDKGINGFGENYLGVLDYFFPETPLTIQIASMVILMVFIKDIKKLIKEEITVKEFPLIPLGVYFASSMFMFMFMFGNGAMNLLEAETDELVEASTFCLMGKVGYYICLIWGSFLAFYYFPNLKTRIVAVVAFILGSFVVLFIMSLILRIPLLNRLIIICCYTAYNLVPAIDIKKVLESNNKNYLNIVSLLGTLFLNLSITISFCKLMHNDKVHFMGIIVVLNCLAAVGLVGYYFYLYYKFGDKPIDEESKKVENKEEKEDDEKKEKEDNNNINNEGVEKIDDTNKVEEYKPPVIEENKPETPKEEDKIDEEGRVY